MKTLDEVIEALNYCLNPVDELDNCNGNCPYIHCCDPKSIDVKQDALYYLVQFSTVCKLVPSLAYDAMRTVNEGKTIG